MKNILNFKYILILLIVTLGACENELYQDPITERVSSSFYSNESEIESAVRGVYAALQSRDLYGLYIPAIGEISSDNTFEEVPANDGGVFGQLDEFTVIPGNGLISGIWKQSYIAIQRANIVLNRIENISFENGETKNARIGEMKFIRALLYFNMVRIYGDVPLVIEETTNPNDFFGQGRTSIIKVYDQIQKDLSEAISQLPINGSDVSRVTKGAAQALLGKVFLTLGETDNAKTHLQAVVNSSKYQLVKDVNDIFGIENENNSEVIFSVQFASGLDGNTEGSNAFSQFSPSGTVANSKGHSLPTVDLYNSYDSQDLRKGVYVDVTEKGIPFSKKLTPNLKDSDDGGSDWIVIRYSDVILMLAEVENAAGNNMEALALLNSIKTRAGLVPFNSNDFDEIARAIEQERKYELIGEGNRWFDLLRTNKAIETMNQWFKDNGKNIVIDQNDLLMPIPQDQIDTDPAIKQNPGY
jgi:tetratricopeptide (TPR) repeat protein